MRAGGNTVQHLSLTQKYTIYTYLQEERFPADIKNMLYNLQLKW